MKIPHIFSPIFSEHGGLCSSHRHIKLSGGRGSAKSYTVVDILLLEAMQQPTLILCTREIQRTIKQSVHRLIQARIRAHGLDAYFVVRDTSIKCANGSEFIFEGLRHNENGIRSLEGVDIAYVEEAQSVSKRSLDSLIPTIRKEGSRILYSYNPYRDDDPVDTLKGDDVLHIHSTYLDNPFCPDVLIAEAEKLKKYDPEAYDHIWLGKYNKSASEMILGGKLIQENTTRNADTYYYGLDWGFGGDPTCFVVASLQDDDVIVHDAIYWYESDANTIAEHLLRYEKEHGIHGYIYCDSADQGSGRILRNAGLPAKSDWGKNKVEDNIRWVRAHNRVVVDRSLNEFWADAQKFKYKTDERTGEVLPVVIDKHKHGFDALSYAFVRHIKKGNLKGV